MAHFTIKSKAHGEKSFWCADNGGYVRLEDDSRPGSLGKQICNGGGFRGATLWATPDDLPTVARRWWKQRLSLDLF